MATDGRVDTFAAQLKAADAAAHPGPWPEEQLVYDDPNWQANYRLIRLLRNATAELIAVLMIVEKQTQIRQHPYDGDIWDLEVLDAALASALDSLNASAAENA